MNQDRIVAQVRANVWPFTVSQLLLFESSSNLHFGVKGLQRFLPKNIVETVYGFRQRVQVKKYFLKFCRRRAADKRRRRGRRREALAHRAEVPEGKFWETTRRDPPEEKISLAEIWKKRIYMYICYIQYVILLLFTKNWTTSRRVAT